MRAWTRPNRGCGTGPIGAWTEKDGPGGDPVTRARYVLVHLASRQGAGDTRRARG